MPEIVLKISAELHAKLKAQAAKMELPVATMIRMMITGHIATPKNNESNKPLTARTDLDYQEHLVLHARAFPRKAGAWEALDYETFCDPERRADREHKLREIIARNAVPKVYPSGEMGEELRRIDKFIEENNE